MTQREYNMTPYKSIQEHLDDCMAWIDECLTICSEDSTITPQSLQLSENRLLTRQALTGNVLLPLAALTRSLALTGFEYFMLLLTLAPELDIKYEYIYSTLQGNPSSLHPTLGLARNLYSFQNPINLSHISRITDSQSTLNRYCFYEAPSPADEDTMLHRSLILKKKTVRYLLGYPGESKLKNQAAALVPPSDEAAVICYPDQYRIISRILKRQPEAPVSPLILYLSGSEGAGRKYLLSQIICDNGGEILSIDMYRCYQADSENINLILDDLTLEAGLWSRFLLLDHADPEDKCERERLRQMISHLSADCRVLFISGSREKLPDVSSLPVISICFPLPELSLRGALWKKLGAGYIFEDDVRLEDFGCRYNLTPGQTAKVLAEAALAAEDHIPAAISRTDLISSISQNQAPAFGSLTTKIKKSYTWNDLQLADNQKLLLRSACSRLRFQYLVESQWGFGRKSAYGKGLSLLFYGPPGTGKTMAAQVIAAEAGLDLYRVDLSQIFNKYIGETEKNIGKIFDEAKKADLILFFDEADSLFSKRTDVSSSNDRHSNAEIAYLLQKIEEHPGVTILSTNLYRNFDPAFLRRLTYTIHFDMPTEPIRLRLWNSMLPDGAPIGKQVDFGRIAKQFELTGSSIRSILTGAAYLAAEEGDEILPKHMIQAIRHEYEKIGKMVSNDEFGEYAIYL